MIDPAALGVGGDDRDRHVALGRRDLAIVAARHVASAIAGGGGVAAAANQDTWGFAVACRKQQGFLAEYEDGGVWKKIRPTPRRSRRYRPRAIDDGRCFGSHAA